MQLILIDISKHLYMDANFNCNIYLCNLKATTVEVAIPSDHQ